MLEMQNSNPRGPMGMAAAGVYRQQPQIFPAGMYVPYMNMYQQYGMRQYVRPQYPRGGYHNNQRQTRRTKPQVAPAVPQVPPQQQAPVAQPVVPQNVPQPVAPRLEPENEKQQIGETIYTRIMSMFPSEEPLWGKLTGMLLESISIPELRDLLKNTALLEEKITQAKDYYDHHVEAAQAPQ